MTLSALAVKAGTKIMMMGSSEQGPMLYNFFFRN